jgi:hypothetical protein
LHFSLDSLVERTLARVAADHPMASQRVAHARSPPMTGGDSENHRSRTDRASVVLAGSSKTRV